MDPGLIIGLAVLFLVLNVAFAVVGFIFLKKMLGNRTVAVASNAHTGSDRRSPQLVSVPTSVDPELKRQAEAKAKELIEQAKKDAERMMKESELKAKDDAFRRREEVTKEFEKTRNELRDNERRLEKREDALEGQTKEIAEKKKHFETQQKKLEDQRLQLEKRGKELEVLIQQETQNLQKLTGLTREEAEKLLLERLERELSEEMAGRIRKANELFAAQAEGKAREILRPRSNVTRRGTPPTRPSALSTFPATTSRDGSSAAKVATSAPSRNAPAWM